MGYKIGPAEGNIYLSGRTGSAGLAIEKLDCSNLYSLSLEIS